jgi:hypothetical protein
MAEFFETDETVAEENARSLAQTKMKSGQRLN